MDIESLYREYRTELFAMSYRMLGSVMDAEDIVQETFIARGKVSEAEPIRNERAFLYKIATNRCLDLLRSSAKKRELYVGPWLPEPLFGSERSWNDPASTYEQRETISTAYLMLLQQLSATERAIFLLRELYQYSYDEIAEMVGKSTSNCRQIFHRAERSIHDGKSEQPSVSVADATIKAFVQSIMQNDMTRMLELVSDNVVFLSDGGGKVKAAHIPVRGLHTVISVLRNLLAIYEGQFQFEFTTLNGQPGLRFDFANGTTYLYTFGFNNGVIDHIYCQANPDKLQHMPSRH
ncbi:RNA polymerase sigma factor SigJ [Paenibacillus sp. strain BS8-2]